MIITITNPRNNFFVSFLGEAEYRAKYGIKTCKEKAQIAINEREYELYARGISGLFSLPQSTAYLVKGYQQDGSDFQYNAYENRMITFEFPQHYGVTSTQQSQVFNQIDHMLAIRIQTEAGTYAIRGHLNGTTEAGLVELECPYPYFTTEKKIMQEGIIWEQQPKRIFLPMKLPQILFGSNQERGVLTFTALFPTDFIITLTGSFTNITIKNITIGTTLSYEGHVEQTFVLDTQAQRLFVDHVDKTDTVRGMFPTLIEGDNVFEFVIAPDKQVSDIHVSLAYQEVVANIE